MHWANPSKRTQERSKIHTQACIPVLHRREYSANPSREYLATPAEYARELCGKVSKTNTFHEFWQSPVSWPSLLRALAEYARGAISGSREHIQPVRSAEYARGPAEYARDRPNMLAEGTGRICSRTIFY